MPLHNEILQLLFEHAEKPMDYVAVFMFLNTGTMGHYQERYSDDEIRTALSDLLLQGHIRAWDDETGATCSAVQWGAVPCRIALTPEGQSALLA